jgi:hypothetical protein
VAIGTAVRSHKEDKERETVGGIVGLAEGGGGLRVSRRMLGGGLEYLDFHFVDSRVATT